MFIFIIIITSTIIRYFVIISQNFIISVGKVLIIFRNCSIEVEIVVLGETDQVYSPE